MPANYVLLERVELNDTAASVTFSNIPQSGYTDLKVVISARTNEANPSTSSYVTFNGSSTSFTTRVLYGSGTTKGSYSNSVNYIGDTNGSTSTANVFGNQEIYIPNYTGSTYKSYSVDAVTENNATTTTNTLSFGAHLWSNTAAITSMTFTNTSTWAANSTFSLYGLAAVGTTPTIAPKASGGSIYTDNTYWYHVFRTTDVFTPQITLSCDVLAIGGGGGGGNGSRGAGAGAGGLVYSASQSFSSSKTITIGAGGVQGGFQDNGGADNRGTDGSSTTFTGLTTALGGGRGGANDAAIYGSGNNGGSGGGSWYGNTAGTGSQGNNGGVGMTSGTYNAGGGGGAGGAGAAGSAGGAGGVGSSAYSSWGLATSTGQNVSGTVYYAGGGSGAQYNSTTSGAAGLGGGGKGNNTTPSGHAGATGTANTGGGGGSGGNGGSGIVIVRYAV